MFGDPVTNPKSWKKVSGQDYCTKITVGVVIKPASYYQETGVPALRTLNVRPNKIILDELVYFSEEANQNELKNSQLKKNDVLIVRTGQPGTAAVVPESLEGANCIDLIIATPNLELIIPKYLCYFYNSDGGKQIVMSSERGQIQKHFNVGSAKVSEIPLPPLNLQVKFAERIQQIEQQKKQAEQSLQKSEELFNSLLQRAFKGELTKTMEPA